MTFEKMHEELESGKAISLSSKKEIAFTKWLGKNNIKRTCYRRFIDDEHIMIIYGEYFPSV